MDVSEVLRLKEDMEPIWNPVRQRMVEYWSLYNLDYLVPVEKKFAAYHPPTAPRIVDNAADHILVSNEIITVPPRKATKEAEENADTLERFYRALALSLDKDLPDPLMHTLKRQALLLGLGSVKGPFWNTHMPDKPARKAKETTEAYKNRLAEWETERRDYNPIIFRSVDVSQVLYPLDIFPPPYVLETGQKAARYIRETYGIPLPGRKDEDIVEWVEYWDTKQRLFIADGISVLKESAQANIGGFIPYTFCYSGLGNAPHPPIGSTSSVGGRLDMLDALALIRGILEPVKGALKQEATMLTALDVMIQLYAYPRYMMSEGGINRLYFEPGPGGIVTVPDGYKLTLLEMPRALPDMYNRLTMLRREIEEATFSGVISGSPPPGVDTGYQTAILVSQARMKFGNLIVNLERAREQMLGNVGRLIEAVRESVTVWAKSPEGNLDQRITPEDFNGHYAVEVSYSGVSPEEADRRTMLGLNVVKSGEISHQSFLEKYAQIPDATGERERILIENLLETPAIQQVLAQEALRAWAGEETLKALEEAEKLQKGPGGVTGPKLTPESLGGGSGMPGLNAQPPGVPQRPIKPGSSEAMNVWLNRLQRGGVAAQAEPLGGPREEVL